ncbi:MAG: cyclopropane fatty acyl phospholipid synthase [Chitinophagaceae bacterium]|nr:cyclopropane fatty acyl phospholipid synthase [Chitinophagaceae bacterium]
MANRYKTLVEEMFLRANIRINGNQPCDILVKNDAFYKRVLRDGQLGIGESYVDGWWECDDIPEMTNRFIRLNLLEDTAKNIKFVLNYLWVKASDTGKKAKAFEVGQKHYDLGNRLFFNMLDERMIYSCAYWKDAQTLDEAQLNKLDLICRKIGLKPGMKVLEIGCGWGGWARHAAEKYGVDVVCLTVSEEQAKFAKETCKGLAVEIKLQDYREATGQYDRVVSIAMFEAVGHKYFRTFMQVAERCLKDDGLFFLHTITSNVPLGPAESTWMNKYIFPNGELPSLRQISKAAEGLFVEEAHHHFSNDYERTLKAWYENFTANWGKLQNEYNPQFFRMWTFYLLISQGICRSRLIHLWHFVYSKDGIPGKAAKPIAEHFQLFDSR